MSLSQLPLRPDRLCDGFVVYSYGVSLRWCVAMKDVDCVGVVDQIHTFAHILHRHAVMMLVQSDVAVTLNRCDSPLLHLIAACRQWAQGDLFDILKELAA